MPNGYREGIASRIGDEITALSVVMILSLCGPPAFAQSATKEKLLEDRVTYLEARLQRLQAALAQAPKRNVAENKAARSTVTETTQPKQPAKQVAEPSLPANVAEAVPPVVVQATPSASSAAAASEASDNAPQELNVLRENSVTLKPRGFEISQELNYSTRRTQLQRDQGLVANTSIRYGLFQWLELSASIPVGYTDRTTNIALDQSTRRTVSGLGDITVQVNAKVLDQTENLPGVVISLGLIAPSGGNPYDFRNYRLNQPGFTPTPNPGNPFAYSYSRGAWGGHTNAEFFKTVDPLILFFGFGVDVTAQQKFSGFTIDAGLRYNYNLGLSFALSEKTTLGFSVAGSYSPDLKVNGRKVFDSRSNPTYARLTVIERLMRDVYLEPSLTFGLNPDTPDFGLGLGACARF